MASPSAARWLCLVVLILVQGTSGQLSIGDVNSFRPEDLGTTTPLARDGEVEGVTEPGEVDYYDYTTFAADFGDKMVDVDNVTEAPTAGDKAGDDDESTLVTRPPGAVRVLADPNPDWLPNWPSQLLQAAPEPTQAFATPTVAVSAPVIPSENELASPAVDPTLTVSKVPVTQYFFDLTSAAPETFVGPLFEPEDVSVADALQPTPNLASSIPELQSSILIEELVSRTVTPTLPNSTPDASVSFLSTASIEPTVNVLMPSLAPTTTPIVTPTRVAMFGETEKVDNTLGDVEEVENTTHLSETGEEDTAGVEATGPRPQTDQDLEEDFKNSSSFMPQLDDAVTDTIAIESEDDLPGSTGEAQASAAHSDSTAPPPSVAVETIASTAVVEESVPSTPFLRTAQIANSQRTPLWMLLSKSSPSQTVNTQQTQTQLTTPLASSPTLGESMTSQLPSSVLESDAFSEVFSSTLLASNLDSMSLESSQVSLDSPSPSATVSLEESLASSSLLMTTEPHLQSPTVTLLRNDLTDTPSDIPSIISSEPTTLSHETPLTESPIDNLTENPSEVGFPKEGDKTLHDSDIKPDVLIPTTPTINTTSQAVNSSSEAEGILVTPSTASIDTATWTPVSDETVDVEETVNPITSVLSASNSIESTTVTSLVVPELTGGFTPIVSSSSVHSDIAPASSVPSSLRSDIDVSITINPMQPTDSPTVLSTATIPDTGVVEHEDSVSVIPSNYSSLDEPLLSSIASKEQVLPTQALPELTKSSVRFESTSEPLVPSFDIVSTSLTSTTLTSETPELTSETPELTSETPELTSETPELTSETPELTVLISEKPTSSPSVFLPGITFTSHEPSHSLISEPVLTSTFTVTTNTELPSAASPITPIATAASPSLTPTLPSSTVPGSIPDLKTNVLAPSTSAATNTDSPTLIGPTVSETPVEETTTIRPVIHDSPVMPDEETESEDAIHKEETTVTPDEPLTSPLPPETTTHTKTSFIPTHPTTPIVTVPASSPFPTPTATQPEATSTFVIPTESMPPLTTVIELANGTVVHHPLPYVKALVAYNGGEFCYHKHNFRALLAQWISSHMEDDVDVAPHEIVFFNMPECGASEDLNVHPEDPIDVDLDLDTQPNHVSETENETSVYFYVTQSGKIDPNLTEQFPLIPTELEISEELAYLKAKVMQLEIVRPDGTSNPNLPLEEEAAVGTSIIVIIVVSTLVGATIILALIFFMLIRKRSASNNYYGRRCTPVSMDAYSMDSVSVYHSFRRKSKRRASGRSIKSYLNQAFDDPNGPSRPLNFAKLTHFISDIDGVHEEFSTIPVNMPKYDELPSGVEDKNRYANVIPVPETRVILKASKDSPSAEYINANYVRGSRNESKYYIATQAPLDNTVADFWRMVWEQETRVVVMLTDFVEKGIDKCADYLPPSETLDCHRVYGEFQVTLKSRDMKEKFVVSNVQLKNLENNLVREVAHMWFTFWPAVGVPNEESSFISFILEVRRNRKKLRAKGPVVVHCSPGTGRTGAFLACDIVMRQFEDQRNVDVARTVYSIRRDRAGAVQTKGQYAFIYRVINLYASKLTTGNLDSL